MIRSIGEKISAGATVKSVYGEPVTVGERTIIPVARVSYGFGAGGGSHNQDGGEPHRGGGAGGGGGGGAWTSPCGVVEITPQSTRFLPIHNGRALAFAAAIGFVLGALISRRRRMR
jgi:uncharacterized spore protein YtfJ